MARKKKTKWEFDPMRLDEASHTELVQIARTLGFTHATLQVPREDLINIILGDEYELEDPLVEIRSLTLDYIRGNSLMLSALRCSTECMTCPHERVVNCFASNSDLILPPHSNPIT
tara:strand:- start:831 stop:1178 length:348 start_codon:yes stop_codon:yes gene_type:complete